MAALVQARRTHARMIQEVAPGGLFLSLAEMIIYSQEQMSKRTYVIIGSLNDLMQLSRSQKKMQQRSCILFYK